MKPRFVIPIAGALLIGVIGVATWLFGGFEPRYGGVPATAYFRNLLGQNQFGGQEDKAKVLVVPPRVGVPILVQVTRSQDPRWRGWYQRIYPKLPASIARRLGPPKSNVAMVHRAIMALGYYGAEASPAVSDLLKLEASPSVQFIQNAAIGALGEIGPRAGEAIPMLMRHFESRSPFFAAQSAQALAKIDVRGERSGALLVSAMNDGYLSVTALDALTKMAANDSRWTSDIWRAAENSLVPDDPRNPEFAPRAAASLQSLGALDISRVTVLCAQSQRNDSRIRQCVAAALSFAADHAEMTAPVLLNLAADSNAGVRNAACAALLRYAQSTNVVMELRVKAIQAALPSGDDSHKWRALVTVQELGDAAMPALNAIIPLLSDPSERIRGKAAEALSGFGSQAQAAKPALEALRTDKWEFVRDAAESALKSISASGSGNSEGSTRAKTLQP